MGAVYPPTHDHGFVLHHHRIDHTSLFSLYGFFFLFRHSILTLSTRTKDTEDDDDDDDEATGEKDGER